MSEPRTTLIHQVLRTTATATTPASPTANINLVGECLEEEHPVLGQRVKVSWIDADGVARQEWLAPLQNLVVRRGDRVLLTLPANWPEPLVTGVLDSLHRAEPAPLRPGPTVRLRADERLSIAGEDGQELLELRQTEGGPLLRLLGGDMDLEFPGRLRLSATEIALEARRGDVRVDASDDVKVRGEVIELN
jgi:hypothetical protein